ncbi:hypothetical protein [Aestuariirhabdus sp. LZHN29]|uniref:hypothetical protein n=1 Tax=Aestuariirhabdus sp. LZHN29 TaxID=3417462 RepID=UPI003CF3E940
MAAAIKRDVRADSCAPARSTLWASLPVVCRGAMDGPAITPAGPALPTSLWVGAASSGNANIAINDGGSDQKGCTGR